MTMDRSKLYIPNPQKWMQFFTSKKHLNQTGSLKLGILPIQKYIPENKHSDVVIKTVSPVTQGVQQAVSDLKREHIKPSVIKKRHHSKRKNKQSKRYQKKKSINSVKKKPINSANKKRVKRKIKKHKVRNISKERIFLIN